METSFDSIILNEVREIRKNTDSLRDDFQTLKDDLLPRVSVLETQQEEQPSRITSLEDKVSKIIFWLLTTTATLAITVIGWLTIKR